MALPPDPIDEVLPQASAAVVAQVGSILFQDEQAFVPQVGDTDIVDVPRELPLQKATLQIKEVLFGSLTSSGQTLEVRKPAGEYVLRAGVEGPFLLSQTDDGVAEIVGLYGPDTYSLHQIKASIAKHNLK